MPKRGPSESFALNPEQINQLWRVCHELADKILVGLLMMLGLRVSEAVHLQASWIREDAVHIPPQIACNCWGCSGTGIWKPKSKAGVRVIPIVETLLPHLLTFLQHQPDGLGYSRIYAWKRVKELAKEAGIAYLSPHILRATAATAFASAGFTAPELCYVMGWANIAMGSHYIQIVQAKAGVARKMKNMFTS